MKNLLGCFLFALLLLLGIHASPAFGQRTVGFPNITAKRGSTFIIPVLLRSQGNESAISFTANFLTSGLEYRSATLGPDAPSFSTLTTNTSQLAFGKPGFLVDGPSPFSASGPLRQVIQIKFFVKQTAPLGCSSLTFLSSPVAKSISSPIGVLLPADWISGCVNITN